MNYIISNSEIFLQFTTFSRQKDETFKMLYKSVSSLERILKASYT
jgi:hypothetical protein